MEDEECITCKSRMIMYMESIIKKIEMDKGLVTYSFFDISLFSTLIDNEMGQ